MHYLKRYHENIDNNVKLRRRHLACVPGAISTWSESFPARSLPGAKVPLVSLPGSNAIHLELSLLGAKVHRNEKSRYQFQYVRPHLEYCVKVWSLAEAPTFGFGFAL